MQKGIKFNSMYSVGNSAQLGVEEILEYMDESFDPKTSSRVKLLYVESIEKPEKLLKHASSLIRKGCRIAPLSQEVLLPEVVRFFSHGSFSQFGCCRRGFVPQGGYCAL